MPNPVANYNYGANASSYLDRGFNVFLSRESTDSAKNKQQLLSEDEFSSLVEGVSGSKITSGVSHSAANDFRIDWDKGILELLDGKNVVVRIGKFSDGTKGFEVGDSEFHSVSLPYLELSMKKTVLPGRVNTARLYVDNGGSGGKNRVMAQFFHGSPKVVATEP